MAEPPLVSIVINNHDYGRFLAAAIDSALTQTHPRIEVVVVDDGSADRSRAVIAGYRARIHAVLQDNLGQGAAVNAGFAACHGRVVNFLDADDGLLPDAAGRAAAALAGGAVQWLAPLALVDAAGQPLGRTFPARPLPSGDLLARVLAFGPWAYPVTPTSGNFWSRAFLEQVLPMPAERFRLGADEYLSALAPLYGPLVADQRPAGRYRTHGANAYWRDRLSLADAAEDCRCFERVAALLAEHAERLGLSARPERWRRRDWRQQLRLWLLHRGDPAAPPPGRLLAAALTDQTRPGRKALLLPALAMLPLLPAAAARRLGLSLLARR